MSRASKERRAMLRRASPLLKPPISIQSMIAAGAFFALPAGEQAMTFADKEFVLRSAIAGNEGRVLWIGTAFRRHLERAGWRFKVLSFGPDPDADDGSLAYVLRVRRAPPGGVA